MSGVVSRRPETFPRFSQWLTAPIAGALAGNVLKLFRVEIDYAVGVTYLEQAAEPALNDLDMAGLTLRPGPDGELIIDAVSDRNNDEVRGAVHVGDRLVQVDGQEMRGRSLDAAVDSLCGQPGEVRALLLARDGEQLMRSIPVPRVI